MVFPLLLVSSVIDYKTQTVPNIIPISLAIWGILKALIYNVSVLFPILSGLITFLFFLITVTIMELITKKYIMGGGDIKIIAALSCAIGIYKCCYVIFFAMLLALAYMLITRQFKDKIVPLCPFIFGGYIIDLLLKFWS